MRVIKKEPGQLARVVEIENELKPLQEAVGGYIECVTLPNGLVVICNEEGLLMGLPYNTVFAGIPFVGTILVVGDGGEDFTDVPEEYVTHLIRAL